MPHELWHKPSAEITHLKTQCESLVENHEADIEDWYFKHQDDLTLEHFLCNERVLKTSKERSCLTESSEKKLNSKKKGESGTRKEEL